MLDFRDRGTYWPKLLPLLLPGESDDVEELRVLAQDAFWQV